jgi:hypothetical protein
MDRVCLMAKIRGNAFVGGVSMEQPDRLAEPEAQGRFPWWVHLAFPAGIGPRRGSGCTCLGAARLEFALA